MIINIGGSQPPNCVVIYIPSSSPKAILSVSSNKVLIDQAQAEIALYSLNVLAAEKGILHSQKETQDHSTKA
jgi:hypothetical protein